MQHINKPMVFVMASHNMVHSDFPQRDTYLMKSAKIVHEKFSVVYPQKLPMVYCYIKTSLCKIFAFNLINLIVCVQ